jgi:predicted flap endonuclease-1-like 5' DNA nuclease
MGLLVQSSHPTLEEHAMDPIWIIIIILIIIILLWLVLRGQANRADLHEAGHHHDHAHDHHHAEPAAAMTEPAPQPMPAEPPAPAAPAAPDDLRKLEGIGPKVASVLNGIGISTFAQLANADLDKVKTALDAAGYQYMNPASWLPQAKLAAAGDWEALAKMQDELKGGV